MEGEDREEEDDEVAGEAEEEEEQEKLLKDADKAECAKRLSEKDAEVDELAEALKNHEI
jgi:hypothetical protein